jgi:hypothetical protein
MSTYQNTTESKEKQTFRTPRTKFPNVVSFLQSRIATKEQKILEMSNLQAALLQDSSISHLVLQYNIDRLGAEIKRDYEHLHKITVS